MDEELEDTVAGVRLRGPPPVLKAAVGGLNTESGEDQLAVDALGVTQARGIDRLKRPHPVAIALVTVAPAGR